MPTPLVPSCGGRGVQSTRATCRWESQLDWMDSWVWCVQRRDKKKHKITFFLLLLMSGSDPSASDLWPQSSEMATHSLARVTLMFVGLLMTLVATVFNTMTEFGAETGEAARLEGFFFPLFLYIGATVGVATFSSDPLCCPAACRCLPAEGGGSDAQVSDAHHAGTLGLLRVGLHLLLDFCHVHVLPGWTLQKVWLGQHWHPETAV